MRHAINLDASVDVLDATHLITVIDLWLQDRRSRLPAHTVAGYEDKISYFRDWWIGVADWKSHEITRSDFSQFGVWLESTARTSRRKPLSWNTRCDVLRRLQACLRWAYADRHYLPIDISAWVPTIPAAKNERRVATVAELARLLDAADGGVDPLRDRCVIAVLMQTGMRRAEILSVQVETISITADWSGTMRVAGKRTKRKPTGERTVAFDAFAGSCLVPYLDAHGWQSGPLLRNRYGDPLSLKTINRIVDRAVVAAGLPDGVIVGPHDLRAAFATHFRRNNPGAANDKRVRMQLGHASDAMTDIYDRADEEDLIEIIRGPLCYNRPVAA